MSATQKKRSAARSATMRYSPRVWSICSSVLRASSAFSAISFDVVFAFDNVLISPSSSRMLPVDSESSLRICDSMSFSCPAICALDATSAFFVSSRSGRSLATVMPSSWSSSPSSVIVKLSSVSFTLVSGA